MTSDAARQSEMSMHHVFTKDDLLTQLRDLRPKIERSDAERLAQHKREEKTYLKEFRAALREALKWDYEAVKRYRGEAGVRDEDSWSTHRRPPGCPTPKLGELDTMIAMVERSSQKRYSIGPSGAHRRLYQLLTCDVERPDPGC